jgi:acylpyruvate hydrolase
MLLVKFDDGRGPRLGCLTDGWSGDGVLDVAAAIPGVPADIGGLFHAGDEVLALVRGLLADHDRGLVLDRRAVRLLAPLARPRRILCVGYNYRGHTGDVPDPEVPEIFAKVGDVVIGPDEPILVPDTTEQADYEAELAVVIGTRVLRATPEQAAAAIGGYTIFNDVTARDWQHRGTQWTLAKSFDTFGPLGPAVATPDELSGGVLEVSASVNGETTVASDTGQMIFTPERLVSYLSQALTLEPGDVIATGTPQRLAAVHADSPWLKPGDRVSISITGLGTLSNPVAAWPAEKR